MNEAHVSAPTGPASVNRVEFSLPLLGCPERVKVVVVSRQGAKLLAQFARTNVAVVIDDRDRLACRAGKWPGGRTLEVRILSAIVRRDRTYVRYILGKTL